MSGIIQFKRCLKNSWRTSLVVQRLRIPLPIDARDMGLIPGLKIPCDVGQLSSGTTTTESTCSRACAQQQQKLLRWEACTLQLESTQLMRQRRPRAAKLKKKKNSWGVQKRIKKTLQCWEAKPDLCDNVKELQLVTQKEKKLKDNIFQKL